MPKLPKITITGRNPQDREEYIRTDIVPYVTANGLFTTTLDQHIAEVIKGYGISLTSNGRTGKLGYFEANTLDGLTAQIKSALEQCVSREEIKSETIIKYSLRTTCSFGITLPDSEGITHIIPHLGWREDGEPDMDTRWVDGTEHTNSSNPQPTTIQFYVGIFRKITYRYRDGRTKIQYMDFSWSGQEDTLPCYYSRWLAAIKSTKPKGSIQEIPYTEKAAKFFVETYKRLCQLSYTLAQFESPETMQELIETQPNMLGLPQATPNN